MCCVCLVPAIVWVGVEIEYCIDRQIRSIREVFSRAKLVWLRPTRRRCGSISSNIDGCGVVAPPIHSSLHARG